MSEQIQTKTANLKQWLTLVLIVAAEVRYVLGRGKEVRARLTGQRLMELPEIAR